MEPATSSRSRTWWRVATILLVAAVVYTLVSAYEQLRDAKMASLDFPPGTPWPTYWFWTPETLKGDTWRAEAEDLAARGPFNLVFATPRYPHTGVDFLDTERFLPLFTETKRILRPAGIGFGLDLR